LSIISYALGIASVGYKRERRLFHLPASVVTHDSLCHSRIAPSHQTQTCTTAPRSRNKNAFRNKWKLTAHALAVSEHAGASCKCASSLTFLLKPKEWKTLATQALRKFVFSSHFCLCTCCADALVKPFLSYCCQNP
jgi:hypothetical protein